VSPETFDATWLALREAVDHRSRAEALLEPLSDWWRARRGAHVVDLGAGMGSNLRYLSPALPAGQEWTLVDHDPELLRRAQGPEVGTTVSTLLADLSEEGLAPIEGADLVTASALLDLVSEPWIATVADSCAAAGAAALFALSYDGSVVWSDGGDATDALVLGAVNRHQRGDKGFGPALGPAAAPAAVTALRARGYETRIEPSPWQLGPEDAELTDALVAGWAAAAVEALPEEAGRLQAWAERRVGDVRERGVGLTVGHVDLLALPPGGR
jgi:SAM-dependent methyltransferase